jgi:Putative transposase of IS4/5 family (DUF4096)
MTKTGCQWRNLPEEYPPWSTVYMFFSRLKKSDLLRKVSYKFNIEYFGTILLYIHLYLNKPYD